MSSIEIASSTFFRSVLACVCLCATVASAEEFQSEAYGYRLEIPEGWVELPEDVLAKAIAREDPAGELIYDAGFQRGSDVREVYYPYALVQVIPYSRLGLNRQIRENEFAEVLKGITSRGNERPPDSIPSIRAPGVKRVTQMGAPRLEIIHRRFFWSIQAEVPAVGAVHGLAVGNFGRSAIIQILFFSRRAAWREYEAEAQAILGSFRFDPASAYREDLAAERAGAELPSRDTLAGGFVVAVIVAAVVLVGLGLAQGKEGDAAGRRRG